MISVCMATYNGEKYIERQLRSILCQLAPEDEVVVVDDASTDCTMDIVRAIGDTRIHMLSSDCRKGVAATFYEALSMAKGEIIFLSDQDDVWKPGKVAKCLSLLQENDLVVVDAEVVDTEENILFPSLFAKVGSREGWWKNWYRCTFYGSGMAFRRNIWEAALPTPKHPLIAHDWWMGEVAEMYGRVIFHNEPLYLYRRHTNNATPLGKSHRRWSTKIAARVVMLYYLVTHFIQHRK